MAFLGLKSGGWRFNVGVWGLWSFGVGFWGVVGMWDIGLLTHNMNLLLSIIINKFLLMLFLVIIWRCLPTYP